MIQDFRNSITLNTLFSKAPNPTHSTHTPHTPHTLTLHTTQTHTLYQKRQRSEQKKLWVVVYWW